MIDFLFVSKTDASKKATLRVDMVDGNIERFTVMWCDGVRGTEFEKNLPWKCGSVLSKTEITTWAEKTKRHTKFMSTLVRKLRCLLKMRKRKKRMTMKMAKFSH